MRGTLILAVISAVVGVPQALASTQSPSFACAHAALADEQAICHSDALSAMDRRLGSMFTVIQHCSGMGSRDVNNSDQGHWLRRRHACGADRTCLAQAYRVRLAMMAPRAAKARKFDAMNECPGPV